MTEERQPEGPRPDEPAGGGEELRRPTWLEGEEERPARQEKPKQEEPPPEPSDTPAPTGEPPHLERGSPREDAPGPKDEPPRRHLP